MLHSYAVANDFFVVVLGTDFFLQVGIFQFKFLFQVFNFSQGITKIISSEVAAAITPVPGGVGPMTIAMLLRNTTDSARRAFS